MLTCPALLPMQSTIMNALTLPQAIRAALKQLGYNDTYHAGCIYTENPRDADMWVDAYRAKYHNEGKKFTREEWDKLLGHCMVWSATSIIHT